MESETIDKFHTVREVSKLLRGSERHTYELIKSGAMPSTRVGRKILIPDSALRQWLADGGSIGPSKGVHSLAKGEIAISAATLGDP